MKLLSVDGINSWSISAKESLIHLSWSSTGMPKLLSVVSDDDAVPVRRILT